MESGRAGNENLAGNRKQLHRGQSLASLAARYAAGLGFGGGQFFHLQALGMIYGAAGIAGRNDHGAHLCQETCGMSADAAKAFDGDPRPPASDMPRRAVATSGALSDAIAGGADFVERNAAHHSRQADSAPDFIYRRPMHVSSVPMSGPGM